MLKFVSAEIRYDVFTNESILSGDAEPGKRLTHDYGEKYWIIRKRYLI